MPKYTITYFDGRGRAELLRVILVYKGVEFVDKRISQADWPAQKKDTPNGQLPILTLEDGTVLPQTLAIGRFLAREHGLVGLTNLEAAQADALVEGIFDMFKEVIKMVFGSDEDKAAAKVNCEKVVPVFLTNFEKVLKASGTDYCVGKSITWADLALALGMSELQNSSLGASVLDAHPLLKAHKTRILEIPAIKAHIKNRKPSPF